MVKLSARTDVPHHLLTVDAQGAAPGIRNFDYRGIHFTLSVHAQGTDLFMPYVLYLTGLPGTEQIALPEDSDPYASAPEAWRHAEQQAMRWVHDRTGDDRGQF